MTDRHDAPQEPQDDQERAPQQDKGRDPSHIAYTVRDRGPDKAAAWNRVGAAWTHASDGKGMDVVLDAMPVDGRVTLRELRKEEFKEQRRDEQERGQERHRDQSRER